MKILYISGSYPPIKCGVGDYLANLTARLNNIKYNIITSKSAKSSREVKNLITNWRFSNYPKIKTEISKFNPDIIHLQYPSACYGKKPFINFLPIKLNNDFPKIKKLITIHEYHDAGFLGRKRTLFTIKPFKNVIVSNREDLMVLKQLYPKKRYNLIYIGSNINYYTLSKNYLDKLKKKYNLGLKQVYLNLGFVDPSKGIENLIKSFDSLPSDHQLIIATDFDKDNKYHQKIARQIKTSKADIIWTGYLSDRDLSGLMQIAYAVVLPFNQPVSLRRGSLIAAIKHNVPTITTGPVNLPLIDRKNCLLIKNNSSKEIEKVVRLLSSDEKLYKLIKVNLIRLAKVFEWDKIAKEHQKIYKKLISEN